MPDLTAHSYEILAWVIPGLVMTFMMFRFAWFLQAIAVKLRESIRGFLS